VPALLLPVLLTAAPLSVLDAYQLVAKQHRGVELIKQGKDWQPAGEDLKAIDPPVIDTKNGYLKLRYTAGACSEETRTAALYLAKGGRTFLAVALNNDCMEGKNSTIDFFELKGPTSVEALDGSGALKDVGFKDFFDEKAPPSVLTLVDEVSPAMRLVYTLPQQGTTAKVALAVDEEPSTGVDQSLGPKAKRLVAQYSKYKSIDLTWDMNMALFVRGSKQKR
jgi:hypothetical protein